MSQLHSDEYDNQLFKYLNVNPEGYVEPNDYENPDEYCPWEPTPATWSTVPDHQNLVWSRSLELLDSISPTLATPYFVEMIYEEYFASWAMRSSQNHESFMPFFQTSHDIDDELKTIIEKAKLGRATVDEALYLLRVRNDLGSIELAKLYHPYGARGQNLQPMIAETQEAIVAHGGILLPSGQPARSVHVHPHYIGMPGTDDDYNLAGSIVTYKTDMGMIHKSDGRLIKVVQRTTLAVMHDDAYGFDATILEKIRQADYKQHMRGFDKDWRQKFLVEQTGLGEYITALIADQSDLDCIFPLSTTHFAYQEVKPQLTMGQEVIRIAGDEPVTDDH